MPVRQAVDPDAAFGDGALVESGSRCEYVLTDVCGGRSGMGLLSGWWWRWSDGRRRADARGWRCRSGRGSARRRRSGRRRRRSTCRSGSRWWGRSRATSSMPVADPRARESGGQVEHHVLLVDEVLAVLVADGAVAAHDLGQAAVEADRLAAAVEHGGVARARDDRRRAPSAPPRSPGTSAGVERVREDVRAGVDLGDARVRAGDVPRAETAARDDLGAQPGGGERVGRPDQERRSRPAPWRCGAARSGSSMQWPS